jgi:hypothetical protein
MGRTASSFPPTAMLDSFLQTNLIALLVLLVSVGLLVTFIKVRGGLRRGFGREALEAELRRRDPERRGELGSPPILHEKSIVFPGGDGIKSWKEIMVCSSFQVLSPRK